MFLFLSVQNEVQPNFYGLCGKKVGLDGVLIQVGYKIVRKRGNNYNTLQKLLH